MGKFTSIFIVAKARATKGLIGAEQR